MVASQSAFAVNDTLVKLASSSLETAQIMALRGVMTTILLVALGLWFRALLPWREAFGPKILLRALADVGTTIAYISALRHLPLANTTAIFQSLPLTITLMAAIVLGERVGWRRWLAIAGGFIGVLVIVRPDGDGFNTYALLVVLSVICAALRDLVTRAMPASIPSLHVACVTAGAVCLTGFLWLPAAGWQPMTDALWLNLSLAAVAVGTGYVLIVLAVRLGELSFVAPFRYSVLLAAFLLGLLVFGEVPTPSAIFGAAIVVASGIYMLSREGRPARAPISRAEVP